LLSAIWYKNLSLKNEQKFNSDEGGTQSFAQFLATDQSNSQAQVEQIPILGNANGILKLSE
jgi:hypothetical protein